MIWPYPPAGPGVLNSGWCRAVRPRVHQAPGAPGHRRRGHGQYLLRSARPSEGGTVVARTTPAA